MCDLYLQTNPHIKVSDLTYRDTFDRYLCKRLMQNLYRISKCKCSAGTIKEKYTHHPNNKWIPQDLTSLLKLDASYHSETNTCLHHIGNILPFITPTFSVYNFTLIIMVSKQGYMWDQTIAECCSSNIISCLYSCIKDNIKNTLLEEITMFCDNCTGQIKNRMITFMLSLTAIKTENRRNAFL